jgi:hypothetical protein
MKCLKLCSVRQQATLYKRYWRDWGAAIKWTKRKYFQDLPRLEWTEILTDFPKFCTVSFLCALLSPPVFSHRGQEIMTIPTSSNTEFNNTQSDRFLGNGSNVPGLCSENKSGWPISHHYFSCTWPSPGTAKASQAEPIASRRFFGQWHTSLMHRVRG